MDLTGPLLFGGLALIALFLVWRFHVRLIQARNHAQEALASIDVQLRKRHDLVPNLVAVAKGAMAHEAQLLESLLQARAEAAIPYDRNDGSAVTDHLSRETTLIGAFGQVLGRVEAHPTLASTETMLRVQETLEEVEGRIAAARRWYNSAARALKDMVETFPGSLLARWSGVRALPFFDIPDSVTRVPPLADPELAPEKETS